MTESLHALMLDSIGTSIVSGQLRSGTRMTLEGMQADHQVSRTVARECMRMLESLGLVVSKRRTGIEVLPPGQWDVLDRRVIRWRLNSEEHAAQLTSLTELRIAVEPMAASLAAHRGTEAELDEIRRAAGEMMVFGSSGRLERYLEADLAFHRAVIAASHNEMFTALVGPVVEALVERPWHGHAQRYPVPEAMDLHQVVMRAICEGNAGDAEGAMRRILVDVRAGIPADPEVEETSST